MKYKHWQALEISVPKLLSYIAGVQIAKSRASGAFSRKTQMVLCVKQRRPTLGQTAPGDQPAAEQLLQAKQSTAFVAQQNQSCKTHREATPLPTRRIGSSTGK